MHTLRLEKTEKGRWAVVDYADNGEVLATGDTKMDAHTLRSIIIGTGKHAGVTPVETNYDWGGDDEADEGIDADPEDA